MTTCLPLILPLHWRAWQYRVVGQERAIDAIQFGMGMKEPGYNIFIAGPAKAGLTYTARTFIEDQARKEPTPPDWCYVFNFKEQDKPKCIKMSAGRGKLLKKDMNEFIEMLQAKIPEVFDSDDYRAKRAKCIRLSRSAGGSILTNSRRKPVNRDSFFSSRR